MYIGIDLALRKIGIVCLDKDGKLKKTILIDSDQKKHNDEELLMRNKLNITTAIYSCINANKSEIKMIALEGLSFNSKSASVDLIAANHWMTRIEIKKDGFDYKIIYPKSWQKSVVTKEILAEWAKTWPIIRAKKGQKLSKEQVTANNKSKAEIRKLTKSCILANVPFEIKESFEKYIKDNKIKSDALYDLADAYHIARFIMDAK